jgi:hypothetical protein
MSVRPENSPVHPWLVERVDTCIAPWTTAMVDHGGGVHPCCVSHRVIGDLRTASFEAIWNGDAARQLRWFLLHGLIHPICRGIACPYVRNTLTAGEPAGLRAAVEAELDEEDYCARYPDVAAAIARGEFRSAREHFQCFGREECRMARFHLDRVTPAVTPGPAIAAAQEWPGASVDHWVFRFDEDTYRAAYHDADRLIRRGIFSSGLEHFFKVGARKAAVPWWQRAGVPEEAWRQRSDVRALHAYASGALEVPVHPIHLAVSSA